MKKSNCKKFSLLLVAAILFSALGIAPAAAAPTDETTLNWGQFLGNEELKGVTDAKIPQTGDDIALKWKSSLHSGNTMMNHISPTVVVGDSIYYYLTDPDETYTSASNRTLVKADAQTGTVQKKSAEFSCSGQLLPQIGSGDGLIFVFGGSSKSKLIAFDAETLDKVYESVDLDGAQIESPIMYHDGYVYAATYGTNQGRLYCFNARPTVNQGEEVSPEWSYKADDSAFFLWSGVEFVDDACVFTNTNGYITSVDKKTGDFIDRYQIPTEMQGGEKLTTTPYYYAKNNRLYVATAGTNGGVLGIRMNPDGSFDQDDIIKFVDTTSGTAIKSSVVVYNDRVYVCGGGGHGGSGAPMRVLDANDLHEIYNIPEIKAKGSVVLSTAYATKENGQEVYLYIIPYRNEYVTNHPGFQNKKYYENFYMYIVRDRQGQTEPVYEKVNLVGEGDDQMQGQDGEFCSQTFTVDKNGNLTIYLDSNYVFCFGNKQDTSIAGADVYNQIDRMPDPADYPYYNDFELRRIQERYNNLSAAEQAKVTNLDKLTEMLSVSSMTPEERLQQLNSGIASLPALDQITLEHADQIERLYTEYQKKSDKSDVVGADKLLAAYARIGQLQQESQAAALSTEIDVLPAVEKVSLKHEGEITALMSRLEALSAEAQAKVPNAAKLRTLHARIQAIHTQLNELDTLIKDTLTGPITLDSKTAMERAAKLTDGLLLEDLLTLSSYEQYFVPAAVDYTNLLIQELQKTGGTQSVDASNAEKVQSLLEEIEKYRALIPEDSAKYLQGAEDIEAASTKLEAYQKSHQNENTQKDKQDKKDNGVQTGDALPVAAALAALATAAVALGLLRKKAVK
ncbi:Uncharacterised protein [Anaerotruncus sp. 2789STDY5834896]|uniref:Uncharacterized protein n=1 Tax=uncultured Anaerotruncus sp. TaxID=905011 RepID=A0A1C6K6H7_9FIRM|nr:Uncharacterised protein [uncultured Anaerotruncus sp.]